MKKLRSNKGFGSLVTLFFWLSGIILVGGVAHTERTKDDPNYVHNHSKVWGTFTEDTVDNPAAPIWCNDENHQTCMNGLVGHN